MTAHQQRSSARILNFEKLESRQLLTATLYVDFGVGFAAQGGWQISNADSASLNGPQIFGNETTLSGYFTEVNEGVDFDLGRRAIDAIMQELAGLFQPFDVNVQEVQATSLADVQAALSSTATNDAYIHVGGLASDDTFPNYGGSLLDSGNTSDNVGFVFTDVDDFKTDQFSLTRSAEAFSVAANIARQAAITFGVQPTEASDAIGMSNVMAIAGTNAAGSNTTGVNLRTTWDFARFELPLAQIDGVSAGTDNSFETLRQNVGAAIGAGEFFTLTTEPDTVELEFIDATTLNLTINDQILNNLDTRNGIEIRTVRGQNVVEFDDVIRVTGQTPTITLEDGSLRFGDNVKLVGRIDPQGFEVSLNDQGNQLQLRENLFPQFRFDIGAGNNLIEVDGARFEGRNRVLEFEPTRYSRVVSGSGDDRIVFLLNTISLNHMSAVDAGTGHDVLDIGQAGVPGWLLLDFKLPDETGFFAKGVSGFDEVAGATEVEWRGFGDALVGDTISLTDPLSGRSLEFDSLTLVGANNVRVIKTMNDLTIEANDVQISSDLDWTIGNTATISHNLMVRAETVLVSDRTGDGKIIEIHEGEYYTRIEGLLANDAVLNLDHLNVNARDHLV